MSTTDYLLFYYLPLLVTSCAGLTCDRCHVHRKHVMGRTCDGQTLCCVGRQFMLARGDYADDYTIMDSHDYGVHNQPP